MDQITIQKKIKFEQRNFVLLSAMALIPIVLRSSLCRWTATFIMHRGYDHRRLPCVVKSAFVKSDNSEL